MKLRATILVVTVAVVFPAVAQAGKVYLEDKLPKIGSTQVTVTVPQPANIELTVRW